MPWHSQILQGFTNQDAVSVNVVQITQDKRQKADLLAKMVLQRIQVGSGAIQRSPADIYAHRLDTHVICDDKNVVYRLAVRHQAQNNHRCCAPRRKPRPNSSQFPSTPNRRSSDRADNGSCTRQCWRAWSATKRGLRVVWNRRAARRTLYLARKYGHHPFFRPYSFRSSRL